MRWAVQVADVILLTCGVLYFSQAVPLALQGHALLRTLPPGNGMLGHAHQGWDAWKGRRLALALRLRGGASATVCDGREGFERSLRGSVGGSSGMEDGGDGRASVSATAVETWDDWGRYASKRTGKYYWYNKRTRATQWHDPRGAQRDGVVTVPDARNGSADKNLSTTAGSLSPEGAQEELEAGWELPKRDSGREEPAPEKLARQDEWTMHISKRNGQPYWFNKYTGKSRWTDPKVDLEDAREEAAEHMGLKWGAGKSGSDGGVAEAGAASSIQLGLSSVTTESQAPVSTHKRAQNLLGASSVTGEMGDEEEPAESADRGAHQDATAHSKRRREMESAEAGEACAAKGGNSSGVKTDGLGQEVGDDTEDGSDTRKGKIARRSVFGSKGAETTVARYGMRPDAEGDDDSDFLHELEEYVGMDKEREREREKQESYHAIWRRERAEEVAQENFVNPSTSNLKSSSHRIGGHRVQGGAADAGSHGRAPEDAPLPALTVAWDSDGDEDVGGGPGRIKVTDFLQQLPGAVLDGVKPGAGVGAAGVGGSAGVGDGGGREPGGVDLPQTGFFRAGTMEREGARYAASSMKTKNIAEEDEEDEDSMERLKNEKAKEQARQDRERARLANLQGLLDGDFSAPPQVVAAMGPSKAEHYTTFMRPARPQQAAANLYKNSGAPTAQNYDGRAKAGSGLGPGEEAQQEQLCTKARAAATRFGGIFRRIQWDSSVRVTIEGRPCWFACKSGHEFLATLADLEKHERAWSHKNWCPVCEKKSKIKDAERFNGRPDESWAHFFDRVDHIRPESHRFAQSRMAAEQARLFETAREQVKDGTEKMEDWWDMDQGAPSKGARHGASDPAAQAEETLSPAQEVERVLAFLRHKESSSGLVAIQNYNLAEICSLLGLRQRAVSDPDALRRHYRRIVLVLHPDKNPHPQAKDAFTAVQQAFEQLSAIQALSRGKK